MTTIQNIQAPSIQYQRRRHPQGCVRRQGPRRHRRTRGTHGCRGCLRFCRQRDRSDLLLRPRLDHRRHERPRHSRERQPGQEDAVRHPLNQLTPSPIHVWIGLVASTPGQGVALDGARELVALLPRLSVAVTRIVTDAARAVNGPIVGDPAGARLRHRPACRSRRGRSSVRLTERRPLSSVTVARDLDGLRAHRSDLQSRGAADLRVAFLGEESLRRCRCRSPSSRRWCRRTCLPSLRHGWPVRRSVPPLPA